MGTFTYGSISNKATTSSERLDVNETNSLTDDSSQTLFSTEVCIILYCYVYSTINTVQVQYVDYMERQDAGTSEMAECSNTTSELENDIAIRVNFIVLGLVVASSGTSFFFVPLLSQISLRIGYKWGVLINAFSLLISCCIWLTAVYLQASYRWMVFAQFIGGVGGGVAGAQALGTSYLSLLCDKDSLTKRLAVTGALSQTAMGLAQLIIGYTIDEYNFTSPFIMATVVATITTVYTATFIKDIRPTTFDTTGSGILMKVKLLVSENSFSENCKLVLINIVLCVHWSIIRACIVISTIYVITYPLCWSSETLGYFLALLFGLGTIGPLLVFFGKIHDLYLTLIGITSSCLLIICCAYGTSTAIMFIGAFLSLFRSMAGAALLAYLSKIYPHPKSKIVLAIAGCVIAVGEIMAPGIYQTIYGFTLQISPSIVFYCMLVVYAPCIVIIGVYAELIPTSCLINEVGVVTRSNMVEDDNKSWNKSEEAELLL